MNTFQKSAALFNRGFLVLMRAPVLNSIIGRSTAVITYTGRKSGRTFTLPVSYSRSGDALTVRVMMPDKKNWWRNFTGDGDSVSVSLAGVDHPGHAITHRDDAGRVSVAITLDAPAT